jgi:hypothetical protein
MTWTAEQIEQIPEPYQDFMLVLSSIPVSPGAGVQIRGIPLGKVFNALAPKYGYAPQHIRALADRLGRAGLIEEDHSGYIQPTAKGEALIEAIAGIPEPEPEPIEIPELPNL